MSSYRQFDERFTRSEREGDWVPVETAKFDRERVVAQKVIHPRQARVKRVERFTHDELQYRLEGTVASRLLERVEVQWPADWWQAFKERWFPAWALRRWPIRYERRRLEAREWLSRRYLQDGDSYVAVEVQRAVAPPTHPTDAEEGA